MLKSTLRKIRNLIIEYFDGDQITVNTNKNIMSMEVIDDSERMVSVKIDTCEDTVSIGVSHKVIEEMVEIYFIKIDGNSIEFHPISDDIELPNDLVDLIVDEINFPLYPNTCLER